MFRFAMLFFSSAKRIRFERNYNKKRPPGNSEVIWRNSFWRKWCFYFLGQADSIEEDVEIQVTKTDFQEALNNLVPSVSLPELKRYKDIQKQFTLATTKKWLSVSLLSCSKYIHTGRKCFVTFQLQRRWGDWKRRSAMECFCRTSRCLDMWWNTISRVQDIFVIETSCETKEMASNVYEALLLTFKALVSGHPWDANKVSATGAGRLREWLS